LSRLPDDLSSLLNLQWINLSNNQLAILPAALVACRGLAEILAAGNKIKSRNRRPAWLDVPRLEDSEARKT
jgi:Leucine-rich repeat (LRR) protein